MKKILFPTDFSEAAKHAFVYALNVAKFIDASIITLHVYKKPDIRGVDLPHSLEEVYNSIEIEEFENYRDSMPILHEIAREHNLDSVPLTNLMIEGETIRTIVKTAEKEDVDFIVMGTKGAGILKEIFFGSVAAEVMEHAPCPVLTVPVNAKFDGMIDDIAITTEYKDIEIKAINKLVKFARIFNAKLHCVHIDLSHVESMAHKMDKWKSNFKNIPFLDFTVVDGDLINEELTKYLEENNMDMVAMLTEKRNFWQELFHFSKAKDMAIHSSIPVLAIPIHTLPSD